MQAKDIIKRSFQSFGLDVVRYVPPLTKPFEVLPLLVEDHLRRRGQFFFLQVGANDGDLDDPIRDIVQRHDLAGLLVEPLPDMFEKLQCNYVAQSRLQFENVAVSDQAGSLTSYRVLATADVPHHWHGMASLSRQHLIKEGVSPAHIQACQVPSTTMQQLLNRHQIRHLDLLQVDTEGYDYEILKFVFACGIKPRIVNYEHCHLLPALRYTAQKHLVGLGYAFLEVGKDTLAVLQDAEL